MEIERLPGDLEARLGELVARARAVAAELGVVAASVRACGDITWQGEAALRFEEEVARRATALAALEGEVAELARTLEVIRQDAGHRLETALAHHAVIGMLP